MGPQEDILEARQQLSLKGPKLKYLGHQFYRQLGQLNFQRSSFLQMNSPARIVLYQIHVSVA